MNANEIKSKIDELEIGYQEFGHQDFEDEQMLKEAVGEFKVVDEHGGGEGDGEDCHVVYYFTEHDVYLRWDGWYASYHGSEWENAPYEVKPEQKVITVFERMTA